MSLRWSSRVSRSLLSAALLMGTVLSFAVLPSSAAAQGPIRSQAAINLTFDEKSGPALDTATAGTVKDDARLEGGAVRIRSPFWGQSGKQAVVVDAGSQQRIEMADSTDTDRPEAVTFSMLYANLHPQKDTAFRGLIGKRDGNGITNYGINFNGDTFQVYLNDGTGFKVAQFPTGQAIPTRTPVFLTVVFQVMDAPSPDEDTDVDDVMIKLFVNAKPLTARTVIGGMPARNVAFLNDVKVATIVNNIPLTIGSTAPNLEPASAIIDEFSLFAKALNEGEVRQLFKEVIGTDTPPELPKDGPEIAAGPQIAMLSRHGLQSGHANTITIIGEDLAATPTVLLPVPITSQTVAASSQPGRIDVTITLPADVPPGHYPLRVQTTGGVSNAVPVAIDPLPELPSDASSPEKPVTLPAALSGSISGGQQVRVHVAGQAGQRFVADVEAKRLGANFSPVLELRNPRGTPIAIAWGKTEFRGDARIVATLPVDGLYTLDLHDLSYNAPGTNPYRLKVGDLKLADAAFPAVVSGNASRTIKVVGAGVDESLPAAIDTTAAFPGLTRAVARLPVDAGAVPLVRAGDSDDVPEDEAASGSQAIDARFTNGAHVPVTIAGRISKAGEVDTYLVDVPAGKTLSLAADVQSIASPAAPQIDLIRPADGALLASSEDRGTVDYAVPGDLNRLKVVVRDLNNKGSRYHLYRLRMIPAGQPNFSLALEQNLVTVAKSGASVVRVDVNRMGYRGPIKLAATGPFRIEPQEIPANATKVFVNLIADNTVPDGLQVIQIRGESTGLTPALVRVAQGPPDSKLSLVPNATADLAVAVGGTAGVTLELGTLPPALFKGVDVSLPVSLKVQDMDAAKVVVRLSLLTTEAPRRVDPNDPAKGQKPLIRSLPEQTLAAGETAGSLRIAVPLDVAETSVACVIRAELVSHAFSDKVLARVYSRSFELPIQTAGSVQVGMNPAMLKGGTETKVGATFNRTAGFMEAVTATLVNLPAGYVAAPVAIPENGTAFELAITAPAVTAAADVPNVVLRITGSTGTAILADLPVAVKVAP